MKIGLGLYRDMLTPDNFRFARQAGATHVVIHLVDYSHRPDQEAIAGNDPAWGVADDMTWGVSANQGQLWTYEELRDIRAMANAEGVEIAAIENFDPSHWYDVLLDGPKKAQQLEDLKTIIRNIGRAGIPCMGYNFTVAGLWGRTGGDWARGRANAIGYNAASIPPETPIPRGTVWNMVYDLDAPPGDIGTVTEEQIWQRVTDFLQALLPVAEESGVRLAIHPEDPPVRTLRGTTRLLYAPDRFQRLLDIAPSKYNALEFCVGTISEMAEGDVYAVTDKFSKQGNIAYVHLRNVHGKVPNYHEVFVDEGDTNMFEILRILHRNHFDGVIIPDHTPQMTCDAPWHAGMAYALGWLKAAITSVERTSERVTK